MGSGKTIIGRKLAEALGWEFVDIDEDVEKEQKVPISEIFDTRGEAEFRKLENSAIRKRVHLIQGGNPMVVALGGGAFAQQANYELIENNGVTVWLDCPLSLIVKRIENSFHRPLARDRMKFEQLYYSRRESYSRADYRIDITGDDPDVAVDAVLNLPIF